MAACHTDNVHSKASKSPDYLLGKVMEPNESCDMTHKLGWSFRFLLSQSGLVLADCVDNNCVICVC